MSFSFTRASVLRFATEEEFLKDVGFFFHCLIEVRKDYNLIIVKR